MGFFDKFKQGLKKTTQLLNTDIRDLFKGEGHLVDDAFLDGIFETLVKTDMGVRAGQETTEEIRSTMRGRVVTVEEVQSRIKAKLKELMKQPAEPIRFAASGPT